MGMELHDNVKQILAGSLLYLDLLKDKLDDRDLSLRFISDIGSYLKQAIEELRRLSHRLAPSIEQNIPLADKIKELIDNMNVAGGLAVSVNAEKMQDPVRTEVQLAIYRIVQELINNTMKHAAAKSAIVQVGKTSDGKISITVEDDGKGFDPVIIQEVKGIGWSNIYSRVRYLKGKVDVRSEAGKGPSVLIELNG